MRAGIYPSVGTGCLLDLPGKPPGDQCAQPNLVNSGVVASITGGQRVWLNSHGDRIVERALPRAGGGTGLYVGNTQVGTHNTNAVGREYFELNNGLLLWCRTNHQGQKTCRQ
jgi:hypothetical protein